MGGLGAPASRTRAVGAVALAAFLWEGSHRTDVDYEALFRKGDVLSTNVYPIGLNCRREPWVTLETPYDVQLQLAAEGKPSGQWLEVNHLDGFCGDRLTPAMVQAEAWLAVEGGARWNGWFFPEGDHGGYLLATNSTASPVAWTRALPGLAEKAAVRRETGGGDLLAGKGGVVSDSFGPLETKIYSWVPAGIVAAPAAVAVTVSVEIRNGAPSFGLGTLRAGQATFVVWNRDRRPQALAVGGPGLNRRTAAIAPGARRTFTLTLAPGTYRFSGSRAAAAVHKRVV
jgi:hypothetical protein